MRHIHATPILSLVLLGLAWGCRDDSTSTNGTETDTGTGTGTETDTGGDTSGTTGDDGGTTTDTGTGTGGELEPQVYVPAGVFGMGCNQAIDDCGWEPAENPAHNVDLSAFWIDTLEVTQSQYNDCIADGGCTAPDVPRCICPVDDPDNPGWYIGEIGACEDDVFTPADTPDLPMGCATWLQAVDYCAWAGGRLPTEAEWEKAARGIDGRIYPWGNDPPTCENAVLPAFGGQGCDGEGEKPRPVGSKPAGASPYGALDMAGNVAEWVTDRWDLHYYIRSPDVSPAGDEWDFYRGMRGGSWSSQFTFEGALRTSSRMTFQPIFPVVDIGFRCVTPEAGLPTCGNGEAEAPETCDDGNSDPGDGCRNDCQHSGAAEWWAWAEFEINDMLPYAEDDMIFVGSTDNPDTGITNTVVFRGPRDVMEPAHFYSELGVSAANDYPSAVVMDDADDLFVVGIEEVAGEALNIMLAKYSGDPAAYETDDEILWHIALDGGAAKADGGYDIAIDADGTLVVAGYVGTDTQSGDAWLARIDPEAAPGTEVVWEATHNDVDGNAGDRAYGLAIAPGGEIVVTGYTTTAKHRQPWLARYDAAGTQIWSTVFDSELSLAGEVGDEEGNAVALDADGNILVAGSIMQVPDNGMYTVTDLALMKFDAAGTVLWSATYDGPPSGLAPSEDDGLGIAVDGDGNAYVSGLERSNNRSRGLVIKWGPSGGDSIWLAKPTDGAQINSLHILDAEQLMFSGYTADTGALGIIQQ
jgi:cysteine-rich repeat protein